VPLTGGFVAKLGVFSAAVDQKQYILALIGMIATAIAAFVYLRIILTMYAPVDDEVAPEASRMRVDGGTGLALTIAAFAVIFLGVVPGVVLDFARDATQLLAK
jgi:NADH-quinone oxidoreductase subunit N